MMQPLASLTPTQLPPAPPRRKKAGRAHLLMGATLVFLLCSNHSHGAPNKKSQQGPKAQSQTAPNSTTISPSSLDALVAMHQDLTAGRTAPAIATLRNLASLEWPPPFDSLMQTHVLAVLHVSPSTAFPQKYLAIETGRRIESAKSLGLAIPASTPETSAAGPDAPPTGETGPSETPPAAPQADTSQKKQVTDPLEAIRLAWTKGNTSEARRLAMKARKNRHGRSCNPHWAYAQFVLARLARSAQNREGFLRHQKLLADHLSGAFCDASRFGMSETDYRNFRWDNLLWSARLGWEFQRLAKADRQASLVLEETIEAGDASMVLEAAQVLFGRIRYESLDPKTTADELAQLRQQLVENKLLSPDLAEFIAFRRAILAWEAGHFGACTDELTASARILDDTLATADTPSLRRDYTKHLYWLARCAQAQNKEKQGSQAEVPEVQRAWDTIHRLAATGYYAMLMQQEFARPNEKEPKAEASAAKDTPVAASESARQRALALRTALDLILKSQAFAKLPPSSFLKLEVNGWVASSLNQQESALFRADPQTLSRAWDLLLAAGRTTDVVLSAGRAAQDVRLDRPEGRLVLDYLFPPAYLEELTEAAAKCGVDRTVLYAVARQESLFNPKAVSPAGAQGLLQVMPSVWRSLLAEHRQWNLGNDPFSPRDNAIVGACHLKDALDRFEGKVAFALAAYNAGEQQVVKWLARRFRGDLNLFIENIPFGETQNYVKQITRSIYHAPRIWETSAAWTNIVKGSESL